jgi:hypothetical protein
MTPVAEIVDVAELVNVIWTSVVAGIGVCLIFSIAIIGFARGTDLRREGAAVAAVGYFVLMAVAFIAVLALVVFGVLVMTSK